MTGRDLTDRRVEQSRSFGAAAGAYERGRPPYPGEAVDWLVPARARRVLDLGAGTGKLTRQLVARGLEVVAVEPLAGMRAELSRLLPGVEVLEGTAEEIPLADGSVDCVLAAQAWHWVDPTRALPEVARVLRPDGRLGLVWNTRDERVGWVAELGEILAEGRRQMEDFNDLPDAVIGAPFGSTATFTVEWSNRVDVGALIDMVASRSYVILLPDGERAGLLDRVRTLVTTHDEIAGNDLIDVPYVTRAFRAELSLG